MNLTVKYIEREILSLFSILVKEIFHIVNENKNGSYFELHYLEGDMINAPGDDRQYRPLHVMKTVCHLIENGARVLVTNDNKNYLFSVKSK